ncbi:DUF6515 family protein [Pseudomonas sp. CAN2814]|uniref:DUF6515 family protein n=1 Tax=Pseudomonas sp. CAN1 TaxID=3046726 RepID=UPI00264A0248|nr:DUF6515 family protein [Pseudomonas sp. CAN1]MDN6856194.1 DUF6515 family protein [Pseudomonas sp. CAN1]
MKSGIWQFASFAVLSLALAVQTATAAGFGGAEVQGGQGQQQPGQGGGQGRPSGGSNNSGHGNSGNQGNSGGGKFGSHEVPGNSGGGWQGRPPGGGNNGGQWQGRPPSGGNNNGQWQGHPPGNNGNNNGQWQGRPPGGNDNGHGRPPGQNGGNQWQGGQGRPPGYGDSQWQNRPPANNGHNDGGKFGSHEVRPPSGNWQGRPPPQGNWGPHPSYWRPGYVVNSMPPGHYRVPYRGSDYFFNDGYWYRPYGGRYVVVTPPYGVRVRYLPSYAEQVWIGSIGYFLAAGTYYLWQAGSQDYEVVAPPQQPQPVAVAQTGYDVIAYPMYNQGPDQQARDRYECHGWAVQQSGFDPASASYAPPAYVADNYRRALAACLSGRGYSVN